MKYHVIIHVPAVKIAVARRDAGILLRLKRSAVNQFLPDAIVGAEIDVLEQLSVQHLIDDAAGLPALNCNLILVLCLNP